MKKKIGMALSLAMLLGANVVHAAEFQDLYVTQAGCRVYSDEGRDLDPTQEGNQNFEIWAFLSPDSIEYSTEKTIQAHIYAVDSIEAREQCEKLYKIFKSGQKATFSLKKHFYDNGHDTENLSGWKGVKIISGFAPKLTENFSSRLYNETGSESPKQK